MNRRTFLQSTAVAPFFVRNLISAPPSEKLRLAAFGAAGMAYQTLQQIGRNPNVTLIAAAEIDSSRLGQLKQLYPDTKVYQDWREMLKKEKKNLDIACVGTPDHMHAPQAMSAMRQGLHVYVQKPLAHDLYEIRKLTEYARKNGRVSQMGIQVHSSREYQTAVQVIHSLAIGKVKEVHSWSNKKWGDMSPMPDRSDPVPSTLDWDGWLGVAAKRPFIGGQYYHPENWRKRLDFGTATFGDMGCHIYDPVFGALKLTAPISVRSEGPAPTQHHWAIDSVIKYVFPGTDVTEGKTVAVTWYDGDKRPPQEVQQLLGTVRMPPQGSIFIGTKGVMLLPHSAIPTLLPAEDYRDFKMPEITPNNHYFQFVEAVQGKSKTSASFDYAGPLTEAVLLGPLATHFPNTTLEWDSAKLKFKNSPEATRLVRREYRSGWHVKGLS
jgi:predicted dehydrogenase